MNWRAIFEALPVTGWPPPEPVFWFALLLVGGALAGELIQRMSRLPRVVGYTVVGVLAAASGYGATVPLTGSSRLVVDLALALLLFEIGSRVHLNWLRFNPALLASSLAESLCGAAAIFFALRELGIGTTDAMACAVLALPASAALAGRVAHELQADGQVTERLTLLTALNTLYGALALVVLQAALHAGGGLRSVDALSALARSFFGSLLLAAVLAAVVAAAARRLDLRNESAVLLVLGLVLLALGTARMFGLSTLLVPLLAGVTLRCSTERPWIWPRHFGTAGGILVLMLFVVVGSAWSPALLASGGLAALLLVGARLLGKGFGVWAFASWSGASQRQGLALAIGLTPLSATALVMLADLHMGAPALAARVTPIVLAAIAVLELAGPIAVRAALVFAGELPLRQKESAR